MTTTDKIMAVAIGTACVLSIAMLTFFLIYFTNH